jgi:hypothetical protein
VANPSAILPPELAALLSPGEEILWQEQPRPYVFIVRGLHNLAYAVTWGVLGAFWYYGASMAPFDGWWRIIPYLSLPFIFAGLSFFQAPIQLGAQARRTWYVVTNRRVLIAELGKNRKPGFRVFTSEEMAPPQVVKRFDGLYDVILTQRAQANPHLQPRLDSGFFGVVDGAEVVTAIKKATPP